MFDEKAGSVLASALEVNGQPITAERAVDARTMRIDYPAPFGPGLRLLDNLPILPRHKLEARAERRDVRAGLERGHAAGDLAGMGPFQLASYDAGQRLVFARNPELLAEGAGRARRCRTWTKW